MKTVEDIKLSNHGEKLVCLELDDCQNVDMGVLHELVPSLNPEMSAFIAKRMNITDELVLLICQQCELLRHVKFMECPNISDQTIITLGKYCKKLQTIAFIYDEERAELKWPHADDALSILVKNCASELLSINFTGFRGITDIGVGYVAECYQELCEVNFTRCVQLTDKSLISLAMYCKLLKCAVFNSTDVTDIGVSVLAEKCSRLLQASFSGCENLTDVAAVNLAERCKKLEKIEFANCQKMTDVALTALMKHCLSLEEINFSWTSLKSIPKYVVCLKRLHKLNIEDCAKLTYPSPDVLNKGLDGLIDFYINYCLNFRLKIFVLGDLSSGKTSMVQNLVGNSSISLPNPTDGVNIQTWYPFKENSQNVALIGDDQLTDSEKCLRLEIWDLSGRPVTQGAHQVYMTRDALYIIVFNVTDQASCDGVAKFVDAVEARSPGSLIILVSTRSDKIVSEEKRRSRNKSVMQSIVDNEKKHVTSIKEEMDRLRQGPVDMKTLRRIEDLEYLLYRRPRFAESVISVSNTTGKGIETLRRVVLTRALDIDIYPHTVHQVTPNGLQLYDELNQLSRCEGKVVISWEEYHNVAFRDDKVKCEDDLETETYFLHATGAILDVRFTCYPDDPNSRYICLNPAAVASAICGLHVDDNKKSFKFEARRFWPKESGYCKPDPGILVRALEEIPANGFVRETLLPLLWQETKFSADQILMMIQLLYRLGILAPLTSLSDQVDELELPYYQSLSVTRKHFVPLLNLLPDNKPQLNWTPKPFKGDIQINWRYEFPIGYPPGCMERLLACCHQAKNAESYQHTWKYGMLLKICDALICINYEEAYFDICCRVNADEEGREKAAVETLWLHLSIFIHAVEKMLQEWRGVYWRISLVPFGAVFFKGDKLDCDPVFDFYECSIRSTREFVLTFLDGDKEHHLDLDLLMPNLAEDVTSISKWMKTMIALRESLIKSTSSLGTHSFSTLASSNGQHSVTSFVTRKNKKKNIEIKWKLDNEIEVPKRVENYAKTDVEIDPKIEKDNVDTDRDNMKETSKVMDITENGEITPEEGEKLLQGKVLTKDEESKEVDRVASGFVASILAQSVADYITSEYEDNKYESTQTLPLSNVVVTAAQAEAAKVTAEAAVATQSGDVDGAARAVLAAAKTVQQAVDKANANHSPNGKSKTCTVL